MPAEKISHKIAGVTYHLIDREDPHPINDSYLAAICNVFKKPEIVTTIMKARKLKGGWESWAQVECALALMDIFPPESILREQNIFAGNTDLVDLWAGGGGAIPAGIELKCRNMNFGFYLALDGLPALMVKDIVKIGNPLKATYPPVRVMYAIGITGDPYDLVWDAEDDTGAHASGPGEPKWKAAGNGYNANLRWCYLHQEAGYTVKNNLGNIGNMQNWRNLYLVWYKLP